MASLPFALYGRVTWSTTLMEDTNTENSRKVGKIT